MPLYNVNHLCSLSDAQQDAIAEAITKTHSEVFKTPRLLVSVVFNDVSKSKSYIAGKRMTSNNIGAVVRHGPSRTQEQYDSLMETIQNAWTEIVGSEDDKELHGIVIQGSIVAGNEAGLSVPAAGNDISWLKDKVPVFRKKAAAGDPLMQDLLDELATRDIFKGILD